MEDQRKEVQRGIPTPGVDAPKFLRDECEGQEKRWTVAWVAFSSEKRADKTRLVTSSHDRNEGSYRNINKFAKHING